MFHTESDEGSYNILGSNEFNTKKAYFFPISFQNIASQFAVQGEDHKVAVCVSKHNNIRYMYLLFNNELNFKNSITENIEIIHAYEKRAVLTRLPHQAV